MEGEVQTCLGTWENGSVHYQQTMNNRGMPQKTEGQVPFSNHLFFIIIIFLCSLGRSGVDTVGSWDPL